eukprot:scaffold122636_cov14-Tisochrysis_lutea.AAC.1
MQCKMLLPHMLPCLTACSLLFHRSHCLVLFFLCLIVSLLPLLLLPGLTWCFVTLSHSCFMTVLLPPLIAANAACALSLGCRYDAASMKPL